MVWLAFVLVPFNAIGRRDPKLTVTYLTQTNEIGQNLAFFAITNFGNASAISYRLGSIEIFGQTKKEQVSCVPNIHRLLPGEGDVIKVFVPTGVVGRWRFTTLYAREGLRSRISDWQWGAGGPGARANWLVPRFLKGVSLDVKATSEWVN